LNGVSGANAETKDATAYGVQLGVLGLGHSHLGFGGFRRCGRAQPRPRTAIFVDIRVSRTVRAPGFREAAFEKTVGRGRYRWLRRVRNARIGGGVKIVDPTGAEDLLHIVVEAAKKRRRVIFFCACEDRNERHRATAAGLLPKSAARKHIPLSVVEWPGEEPRSITLLVDGEALKAVIPNGKRIPLDQVSAKDLSKFAALPWGSRVTLRSDAGSVTVIAGPAKLAKEWYLPIIGLSLSKETDTAASLKREAIRLRKTLGLCRVSICVGAHVRQPSDLPDILQNVPESAFRSVAHGSIRIQEGEPQNQTLSFSNLRSNTLRVGSG
jgi:hypothetical protein